jgi:hypothetical protein
MYGMTRWVTKKSIGIVLILVAVLYVTVFGFSSNFLPVNAHPFDDNKQAFAILHTPRGVAGLLWSQSSNTLVVTVSLSGLAPNSTHPDAIHIGSCKSRTHGPVVLGLNPVNADSTGKGSSVTAYSNVLQGIPAQGWYIDVHNGPQLANGLQQERIACANITNPHSLINVPQPPNPKSSTKMIKKALLDENPASKFLTSQGISSLSSGSLSGTRNQIVNVNLGGSADDNQSVTAGEVVLFHYDNNGQSGLGVIIILFPLVPNTTHIAHIHNGSCENQGSVAEQLNPVQVDSQSFGSSITYLPGVSSIPTTGWYVNVHLASTADELGDQTGFDPIACGNISTVSGNVLSPTPLGNSLASPTSTPFIE